jgi:ATP-dependent Lhr-like helicase
VENPPALARFLSPQTTILEADPGPDPDISMLETEAPPPWSGGGGRYAIPAILNEVTRHQTTLIFHNTRAQAELFFHDLWLPTPRTCPSASTTAPSPANSASGWNRR